MQSYPRGRVEVRTHSGDTHGLLQMTGQDWRGLSQDCHLDARRTHSLTSMASNGRRRDPLSSRAGCSRSRNGLWQSGLPWAWTDAVARCRCEPSTAWATRAATWLDSFPSSKCTILNYWSMFVLHLFLARKDSQRRPLTPPCLLAALPTFMHQNWVIQKKTVPHSQMVRLIRAESAIWHI